MKVGSTDVRITENGMLVVDIRVEISIKSVKYRYTKRRLTSRYSCRESFNIGISKEHTSHQKYVACTDERFQEILKDTNGTGGKQRKEIVAEMQWKAWSCIKLQWPPVLCLVTVAVLHLIYDKLALCSRVI